eukprot:9910726-Heterocapsa_arctica.AAC.1
MPHVLPVVEVDASARDERHHADVNAGLLPAHEPLPPFVWSRRRRSRSQQHVLAQIPTLTPARKTMKIR